MTKINGKALKFYRLKSGILQEELAKKLGRLSKATVSAWEKEVNPVPLKYHEKICEALNVSVSDLAGSNETEKEHYIENGKALCEYILDAVSYGNINIEELAKSLCIPDLDVLQMLLEGKADWPVELFAKLTFLLHLDIADLPVSRRERMRLIPFFNDYSKNFFCYVFNKAQALSVKFDDRRKNFIIKTNAPMEYIMKPYAANLYGFRVEDVSMSPAVNQDDVVLCDIDSKIENGNIVVFKHNKRVYCRIINISGSDYIFSAISRSEKIIKLKKKNIEWCFPVASTLFKDKIQTMTAKPVASKILKWFVIIKVKHNDRKNISKVLDSIAKAGGRIFRKGWFARFGIVDQGSLLGRLTEKIVYPVESLFTYLDGGPCYGLAVKFPAMKKSKLRNILNEKISKTAGFSLGHIAEYNPKYHINAELVEDYEKALNYYNWVSRRLKEKPKDPNAKRGQTSTSKR